MADRVLFAAVAVLVVYAVAWQAILGRANLSQAYPPDCGKDCE